jgi:hypothetical protein
MSRRIRSKKAVFTNLANQIHEREMLKILLLYYPSLDSNKNRSNSALNLTQIKPVKMVKILKRELCANELLDQHLRAISSFLGHHIRLSKCQSQIVRWGKVRLHGKLIHSCLSDSLSTKSSSTRYSRWFEV